MVWPWNLQKTSIAEFLMTRSFCNVTGPRDKSSPWPTPKGRVAWYRDKRARQFNFGATFRQVQTPDKRLIGCACPWRPRFAGLFSPCSFWLTLWEKVLLGCQSILVQNPRRRCKRYPFRHRKHTIRTSRISSANWIFFCSLLNNQIINPVGRIAILGLKKGQT